MGQHRAPARYGRTTQALHWATAILVLIAFTLGPGGSERHVYSSALDPDRQIHETLGLCVLALAVLRVLWRLVDRQPDPVPTARWLRVAAQAAHVSLYVLLFALPLTAIAGAWLEGHPLTLLGHVELASPVATSHDAGEAIAILHTWLGDAIMWLAGVHALAAIYHHLVVRDGVLVSMLPPAVHVPPPQTRQFED